MLYITPAQLSGSQSTWRRHVDIEEFFESELVGRRSRLIPFDAHIRFLHALGFSFQAIANFLASNKVQVTRQAVHDYLRRYAETHPAAAYARTPLSQRIDPTSSDKANRNPVRRVQGTERGSMLPAITVGRDGATGAANRPPCNVGISKAASKQPPQETPAPALVARASASLSQMDTPPFSPDTVVVQQTQSPKDEPKSHVPGCKATEFNSDQSQGGLAGRATVLGIKPAQWPLPKQVELVVCDPNTPENQAK